MIIDVSSEDETKNIGKNIGDFLKGGEFIELIGDVGAGKTTLVKGIAVGLEIDEYIQSPSFTINRVYSGHNNITLIHYDFYRINDAGIMANEIKEYIDEPDTVVIIEWEDAVKDVLPTDRLSIEIILTNEISRKIKISSSGKNSSKIMETLKI